MHVPDLSDQELVLRQPRPSDVRDRLASGSNAELVRMYGGDYLNLQPMTKKEASQWYEQACAETLGWIIEVDGLCVGRTRLHSLWEPDRRARYAIGIFNPDYWSRGVGTRVTRLVLRYAFDTLKLHRVDLRVLAYNTRARACYRKCGFFEEGVERESAFVAGEWQDDVMMSILEHEFRAHSSSDCHQR